jgi:parvulin-like peptidyl-prolyl isomerase
VRWSPFALAAFAVSLASAQPPSLQLADRIVAVVDEDPILASDLEQAIGLGLESRRAGEDDTAFRRRVLDALIEQRLRFHEVDRFGFTEVPVEEIEARFEDIRSQFPSVEAFRARLRAIGSSEEALRQLVARQLMVLTYVEERVGARVFVALDDIRAYYESVLVPEMRRSGAAVPPIEEVREQIRAVLREQRLDEEIERWTAGLRAEADVVDHFERERGALPPLRFEVRAPSGRAAPAAQP